MNILKQGDEIPWSGCAATVGFFDGVHAGHRFLLEELKELAAENGLTSVVITFAQHPRTVLSGDYKPKLLSSSSEKLDLLAQTEVDSCVVLNFDLELAKLTAEEFIKKVLIDKFKVKLLLVGYDHRFGRNRDMGFEDYVKIGEKYGVKVIKATQFSNEKHQNISSSQIRKALEDGDVENANEILTYPYFFEGKVVEGNKIGRTIGFPTANIFVNDKNKMLPAVGVYAAYVFYDGKKYKGMMNIGYHPTVPFNNKLKAEVNIFDFDSNIYGDEIRVEVIKKIRVEQKFEGLEQLKNQLSGDKKEIIKILQ